MSYNYVIICNEERCLIVAEEIRVARVIKCWDPSFSCLELNLVEGTPAAAAAECVLQILKHKSQLIEKKGQAPKGKLERKIGAWLKAVQGKKSTEAADALALLMKD